MNGYRVITLASLIWTAALVGLVFPRMERGREPPALDATSQSPDLAVAILQNAHRFEGAAVGFAGVAPNEVLAWRVIYFRADAERTFLRLLDTATPAGQLYALAGLRMSDSAMFARQAERFRGRSDKVWTLNGCIGSAERFDELVAQISRGEWARDFAGGRLYRGG